MPGSRVDFDAIGTDILDVGLDWGCLVFGVWGGKSQDDNIVWVLNGCAVDPFGASLFIYCPVMVGCAVPGWVSLR